MTHLASVAGLLLVLCLTGGAALATGEPTPIAIVVDGPADCPAPARVMERLRALGVGAVVADGAAPARHTVRLVDGGERHAVGIDAQERRWLPDAARDCEQRAQAVAVLLALALEAQPLAPADVAAARAGDTRELASDPEAAPLIPTRLATGRGPESAGGGTRRYVALELDGRFDIAPIATDGVAHYTGGGALRLVAGVRTRRATIAALWDGGVEAPARLGFSRGAARVLRIPQFVGVRADTALGPLRPGLELGILASGLRLEGEDLPSVSTVWGWDLAVRAAALVRIEAAGRVGPHLRLEAGWSPSPRVVTVAGMGEVGRLPSLWLTVALGLHLDFP